jgi:hypothetical protein
MIVDFFLLMTLSSYSEPASNSVPSARKVTNILAKMMLFSAEESSAIQDTVSRLSWGLSSPAPQDIVVISAA